MLDLILSQVAKSEYKSICGRRRLRLWQQHMATWMKIQSVYRPCKVQLAYTCACMHDMLYAQTWPKHQEDHGDIGDIRPDQAKQGRVQTDTIHHDANKQSIEEITRTCYHLYGMHVYSSCPQQLGLCYNSSATCATSFRSWTTWPAASSTS
jgi:hypothetical protein